MDELSRQVAQMALRLAALPPEATRNDMQSLEVIEQLALRILREVSARRVRPDALAAAPAFDARETRGSWAVRAY
jgi:hypothetical protein